MRARRSSVLAIAALALLGGRAANARADSSAVEASIDFRAQHLRTFPDAEHEAAAEAEGRSLPQAGIPIGSSANFVGAGVGFEVTLHDRIRIPLLGMSLVGSFGSSPRVIGSIDGSIAEVDTWKSGIVTFLFPGYGFRSKARRWMFEGAVQPGFAYLFTSGSIASGARTIGTSFHASTFVVQADVAVCRRLDPIERACLFVAPAIYEYGWLNALTVGLRWEVGP